MSVCMSHFFTNFFLREKVHIVSARHISTLLCVEMTTLKVESFAGRNFLSKNELMLFKRDDNRGYGASNLVDSLQVMYVKYNDN